MPTIIPAILATTEEDYRKKLQQIEGSGLFKDGWVQIDLMDNKFVQNKSISPEIIAKFPTKLKLEGHLMVEYPENWIDGLVKTHVDRIIFPVEDIEGVDERIKHIKNHDKEVGLAINPETSLEKLDPYLDTIDVLLIMSVHPGFQGHDFLPESVGRVKESSRLRSNNNLNFKIEVDGGVSEENAKELAEAGADFLVVGSALYKYGNLEVGLKKIQEAVNG